MDGSSTGRSDGDGADEVMDGDVRRRGRTSDLIELTAFQPEDVSVARRAVVRQLGEWGFTDADDAVLVFSELVNNAVMYAAGAESIVVSRDKNEVHIEVHDSLGDLATRGPPSHPDGGHGLSIVEQLATGWGWQATTSGKVVWATMSLNL